MTDKEALQILTGTDVSKIIDKYELVMSAILVAQRALADKLSDYDVALLMAIEALKEKVEKQEDIEKMIDDLATEYGEDE